MKFICEGIDLSDAVMKVVKACSTKTTNPILETVRIAAENDSVTLLATDGEIAMMKKIKADVHEEGAVCVPGRFFADFVKRLEGEQITISSENDSIRIHYADSQTCMQTLSADDFPAIDFSIDENSVEIRDDRSGRLRRRRSVRRRGRRSNAQ